MRESLTVIDRVARSLIRAVEERGLPGRICVTELIERYGAPPTKMLRRVGLTHAADLNAQTTRAPNPFTAEYERGSWQQQVKSAFHLTPLAAEVTP